MKILQGDVITLSQLSANSDSDENVNANLQQSSVDQDQSPRDEGKPERADFLCD
jgi:hypothetical protein